MEIENVRKRRDQAAKEISVILQELLDDTQCTLKEVDVKAMTHSSLLPGSEKKCLITAVTIELSV